MQKIVAILGHRCIDDITVADGMHSHTLQRCNHFITAELHAQRLMNLGHRAGDGLLEVIRNGDLTAELSLFAQDDLDGKDLKAHVTHITGHDRGCKQQVLQVHTREFEEEVLIPYFDSPDAVAVDDRREGEHIVVVVVQEGEERMVADNMTVLFSLGMFAADLAQGQLLIHSQGNEGGGIGIGATVVNRVLDQIGAVDSHGNGLTLAPKVGAQLLLALDQGLKVVLAHLVSACGKPDGERSHFLDRSVDDQGTAFAVEGFVCSGEEIIEHDFFFFVGLQQACDAGRRPQVRAVGIVELDFQHIFLMAVQLRLGNRELCFQLTITQCFSQQAEKEPAGGFNLWH
ncbi:hypothetical protein DSECCO2_623730 [anaerobic digester metagenome]